MPAVNLNGPRAVARRSASDPDQSDEQRVGADGDEQQHADAERSSRCVGAHLVGVHEGERDAEHGSEVHDRARLLRANSLRGHDVSTAVATGTSAMTPQATRESLRRRDAGNEQARQAQTASHVSR